MYLGFTHRAIPVTVKLNRPAAGVDKARRCLGDTSEARGDSGHSGWVQEPMSGNSLSMLSADDLLTHI